MTLIAETTASCGRPILLLCYGISHYVDVRCLNSTAPSHETLVAGEYAKLVDYARIRVPDRSKLVFL